MENLLKNNETISKNEILFEGKLHWISFLLPGIYAAIGSIGIIPIFILRGTFQIFAALLVFLFCTGLLKIIKNKRTLIYCSNSFLSISNGVFSKQIIDISLKKMEGIELYQSWIGKALNFGTLVVSTGGIVKSYNISNPSKLREIILQNHNYRIRTLA